MKTIEQRRLKFRVWDNCRKEWVHGPGDEVSLFGEAILLGYFLMRPDESNVSLDELNDMIALQFTGQQDKNCVEIYDGDIVLIKDYEFVEFCDSGIPDSPGERYKDCYCLVCWSGSGFVVDAYNGMGPINLDYFESNLEVIGNIFTHPHLLEPGEK